MKVREMKMIENDSIQAIRSETQTLKRKIHLKGQALKLIRVEREELKEQICLLKMKTRLESQMKERFDPVLSSKLDCVVYLLASQGVCPNG
jgi:hypothetical protein